MKKYLSIKMLRSIIKMLLGLCAGIAIGLLIAAIGVWGFTDTTVPEYTEELKTVRFGEAIIAAFVAGLAFIVSLILLIPLHEAGHLICGLLSGYKFVSFRIFNLTFIKIDGKIRIKKFSIAGTGGQCLLTPPDLPLEKIPTGWYNFGGVLSTLIILIPIVPLLWVVNNPFMKEAMLIFLLTDGILILMNGIPMKISGTGNDAYNIILLRKNLMSKRGFVNMLKANAFIKEGIRPKDMPDEWFRVPDSVNYKNQLEMSIPLMAASRLIDEGRYYEALNEFENLYNHKQELIPLYVKEIACELVFLRLLAGNTEGASELLDNNLKKYIEAYCKVISSKGRILFAIYLILENDRDKAIQIYDQLNNHKNDYLLPGEVRGDLAIMTDMLSQM